MHAPSNLIYWALFLLLVAVMIVLDLVAMDSRKVRMRTALVWTAIWVLLTAAFAVALYFFGQRMAADTSRSNLQLSLEFITAYVVEESLSLDNLFVFLLIFRYFKVPSEYQHKVLLWGILGAIVTRGVFIGAGIALLNRFHWVMYLLGAFLLYAGIKLLLHRIERRPEQSWFARFAERHMRLTGDFGAGRFLVLRDGVRYLSRLALVLVVIEMTDVIFAVDSIPAVLAVTRQPFVAFTSNIFAVLGLRALFLTVSGLLDRFHLLHYGLATILAFIGAKMLAASWIEISTLWALGFVALVLGVSMTLSIVIEPKKQSAVAE
jgi:tellurite resistance protein TerC